METLATSSRCSLVVFPAVRDWGEGEGEGKEGVVS